MAVLTVIAVIVTVLILFISYQVMSSSQQKQFDHDVEKELELINSSLLEPVFAYDFQQIQAIAASLVNTTLVHEIKITDHRGKELAAASDENALNTSHKVLNQGVEIMRDGQLIGRYDITFSTRQMESLLHNQTQTGFIMVLTVAI